MKAIVQDRFGSPDVLELREIDPPEVGGGDVLVRVQAATGRREASAPSPSSSPGRSAPG